MDRTTIAYWTTTGLFCAALGFSGIAHSFHLAPIPESMAGLGYPAYVMSILGAAKLLGVAVLLAPGLPLLKEWAYAGFGFNLLGASASHAFAGDPLVHAAPPIALLALAVCSYLFRPDARRLRDVPSLGATAGPSVGAIGDTEARRAS